MNFNYEENVIWDDDKERIIGNLTNSFNLDGNRESVTGEWWNLKNDFGIIIGYGWIVIYENEVEISLVVSEEYRGKGLSKKILNYLEEQILLNDLPKNVVAIINETNEYKYTVAKLLTNNGYAPEGFDVKYLEFYLSSEISIAFCKKL